MRKLLLAGIAAATVALTAGTAQAAIAIGSTPAVGPNPNDVMGAVEGLFGANVYYFGSPGAIIDVYYLGFEAGARNEFSITGVAPDAGPVGVVVSNGSTGLSTIFGGGTAVTYVGDITVNPGLLSFRFDTSIGPASVLNGANTGEVVPPNFFSSFATGNLAPGVFDTNVNGTTPYSGNMVLLALDDGGNSIDDNHDDLVVVLRLRDGSFSVPEPATIGLLGAGLLGLGFAARRRRNG